MQENLQHNLKDRHIQMIAIGGAIGTGFFLGSASAIQMTGPSIALAYIVGGLIIYGVMRALGEMTVDYPSSGSFVEYAHRYLGAGAGFVAGWNAWLLFTAACMLEVTAVGTLLDYWIHIPHWITCIVLLLAFGGLNLIGVKYFGETEFWFAGIKVAVIIFMIVTGVYLIFADQAVHHIAVTNLHDYSDPSVFFSHGLLGFFNSLVIVCLSFCGSEFVSVAAGEAENPKKSIPKAINGVVLRIILFYVLTMAVIVLMYPFQNITKDTNPFTDVFVKLGFAKSADIINLVAITASLSALNSCIYVAARFVYRMALNGQAPRAFAKTDANKLPRNAILFTCGMAFLVVIANYTFPAKILQYLFALITVAIIINWYIILLAHMLFRKQKLLAGEPLVYSMPGYPYVNMLVMGVLFIILVVMSKNTEMELSVYIAPAWLLILSMIYAASSGRAGMRANSIK
ncbi:MAG: amino acid permease [Burkholderiales bacterium]|nr:amino acid permease [Burkholderiales bacterium]MBX9865742.1 amino acid permease [Burkholderiales bacterium]